MNKFNATLISVLAAASLALAGPASAQATPSDGSINDYKTAQGILATAFLAGESLNFQDVWGVTADAYFAGLGAAGLPPHESALSGTAASSRYFAMCGAGAAPSLYPGNCSGQYFTIYDRDNLGAVVVSAYIRDLPVNYWNNNRLAETYTAMNKACNDNIVICNLVTGAAGTKGLIVLGKWWNIVRAL